MRPCALQGVFHVEGKYTSRGPRLIEVNCRMVSGARRQLLGGGVAVAAPDPAPPRRVQRLPAAAWLRGWLGGRLDTLPACLPACLASGWRSRADHEPAGLGRGPSGGAAAGQRRCGDVVCGRTAWAYRMAAPGRGPACPAPPAPAAVLARAVLPSRTPPPSGASRPAPLLPSGAAPVPTTPARPSAGIPSRPNVAARPLRNIAEYSVNALRTGRLRDIDFLKPYQGRPDVLYANPLVEAGEKVRAAVHTGAAGRGRGRGACPGVARAPAAPPGHLHRSSTCPSACTPGLPWL